MTNYISVQTSRKITDSFTVRKFKIWKILVPMATEGCDKK